MKTLFPINKVTKPELRRRRGKTIHVHPDIVTWQKRRRRFNKYKKLMTAIFIAAKLTPEQIKAFLDTPNPLTSNNPPKQYLTYYRAHYCYKAVLETFGKTK